MNDLQKISLESPPPYNHSSCSPLVHAETTTTRTEVVTTTTETTTHFFSLPQFRRRAPSQQSPKDDYSDHKLPDIPSPSDIALFDKALPPTPPNEIEGSQNVITHSTQDLITSSPVAQRAKDVVHFATSQTHPRATFTPAALGKGLPRSSPAPRLETNTIPFVSSPLPIPTPTIRKSRSFQWLKRSVSENGDHLSQRQRGSSFGTNSFSSIGVKNECLKLTEISFVDPKAVPQTISRRASFWSKKRILPSDEPSNQPAHNEDVVTLPVLPPVHHVSPFNISHFAESPSSFPIQTSATHTVPFSDPFCDAKPRETVALNPRPRAQTNPPFLRRFSMGVFSAMELPLLDLQARNSADFPTVTQTVAQQAVHKSAIPKPLGKEESPDVYLIRLLSAVSKAEVAGILASRYVISLPVISTIFILGQSGSILCRSSSIIHQSI